MGVEVQIDDKVVTISLMGSFDIGCYEAFNESYKPYMSQAENVFIVDMQNATYMDSSALGMLLLLRDRTGGDKSRVIITNVGESVMEILKIANFDQLFNIQARNV
ncbi:MAG: STAS domain-containing protein [Thiotrichales bacterium]|nr:STAS domain-containing protein [Thiotrichales bacterium]